ncbi:hypothetical protein [Pedobacter nutrimenti]|nr:hypothetical protein [Pedobacter nutrimenti]|eukprot:gene13551-15956_t
MRKTTLIQLFGVLSLAITSCAPTYYGKTYAPTQNVDVYMDAADVKKPYTTMGTADNDIGPESMEKSQSRLMQMAQQKGADGMIIKVIEKVTGSTETTSGTTKKGDRENKHNSQTQVSNHTEKRMIATFIKYGN